MDLLWAAGGEAEHHAISPRKVGVLIACGSTATYQKHLCSSQRSARSESDLKSTALYSSPSPGSAPARPAVLQPPTRTRGTRVEAGLAFEEVFLYVFIIADMNLPVYVERPKGESGS